MRTILTMLVMLPGVAAAAPRAEYQPLAFLAGHCWKGEFPGGAKTTDEHCFTWIYDGKFLRDQHTVRAAGKPDAARDEAVFVLDRNPQDPQAPLLLADAANSAAEIAGAYLITHAGFLERLLGTTDLTSQQWGIALLAAVALLVCWEIAKWIARRSGAAAVAG